MKTAIVIGAGVTGLSTAYHLAKRGYGRVQVLEKNEIGAGSSSRAAGISTGLLWSETGVRARRHSLRIFREEKTSPSSRRSKKASHSRAMIQTTIH